MCGVHVACVTEVIGDVSGEWGVDFYLKAVELLAFGGISW